MYMSPVKNDCKELFEDVDGFGADLLDALTLMEDVVGKEKGSEFCAERDYCFRKEDIDADVPMRGGHGRYDWDGENLRGEL